MGYFEEQELDSNWACCLLEDIPVTCCDAFSWDSTDSWSFPIEHPFVSPTSLSKNSKESCDLTDCCRKRIRGGSSCASNSRAFREKLRRDRVNDRFLELSAVLEPGKAPKLDKAAILTDAVQMIKLLQQETTTMKNQNVELSKKISVLKAEKKELKAEKHKLKAEKDQIEQKVKTLCGPNGVKLRPTLTPIPYSIPRQPVAGKMIPVYGNPGVPLWHFVPLASVDTSQNHALHPPVA